MPDGAAADHGAFFVGENDHLQRVAKRQVLFMQYLGHLDRAKRAHVTVIVATFRNRIDVRADHDRTKQCVGSRARTDDIACSVDADL